MKDKVFIKSEDEGIWQNNPYMIYVVYLVISILIFFILLFTLNPFLLIIGIIVIVIGGIILPVKINNDKNVSKSIGFIKRNNQWYAIKLMYDSFNSDMMIEMPSGSVGQAVVNSHNAKMAQNIQKMERKIKEDRNNPDTYIEMLDEVLESLNSNNYKQVLYDNIDKKIDKSLNGYAFNEIYTMNNKICGYINLKNLKVEKVEKKYIILSYDNDEGIRTKIKFRNVYNGLINEINK